MMAKGEATVEALNFASNVISSTIEYNKDDIVGEFSVLKEPVQRLNIVDEEASYAMDLGDYDKALSLRMQEMALVKLCLADPDSGCEGDDLLANAHIRLGETYYAMGYTEQVLWHAKKAMEFTDQNRSDKAGQTLLISALVILSKGMLMKGSQEAINYLQRARSLNYNLNGQEDISNVPIHEGFAEFYVFSGDSKLLSISDLSTEGSFSSEYSSINEGSGINSLEYDKTDNYTKAVRELKQAWELLKKRPESQKSCKFDLQIPSMASIFVKISQAQVRLGNFEDAAGFYEKAVNAYSEASMTNKAILAQLYFELGVTYYKTKRYGHSSTALEKAAAYCEEQLDIGMENPLTVDVVKQQAITFYKAGDHKAAKEALEYLHSTQRKMHGSSSMEVAETVKSLGDVCIVQNQQSEAANYYNRALRILRKKLGSSNEIVKQLMMDVKELNLPKISNKSHSQSPTRRPLSPDRMKLIYVSS